MKLKEECGWFNMEGFCGGFNCCQFVGNACPHFPLKNLPGWAVEAGLDGYDLAKDSAQMKERDDYDD